MRCWVLFKTCHDVYVHHSSHLKQSIDALLLGRGYLISFSFNKTSYRQNYLGKKNRLSLPGSSWNWTLWPGEDGMATPWRGSFDLKNTCCSFRNGLFWSCRGESMNKCRTVHISPWLVVACWAFWSRLKPKSRRRGADGAASSGLYLYSNWMLLQHLLALGKTPGVRNEGSAWVLSRKSQQSLFHSTSSRGQWSLQTNIKVFLPEPLGQIPVQLENSLWHKITEGAYELLCNHTRMTSTELFLRLRKCFQQNGTACIVLPAHAGFLAPLV